MDTDPGGGAVGPDAAALAERIRAERHWLGLNQADVAAALNISRAAVSALETGRRRVSGLELKRLSELFGVSVDRLAGGTGGEDPTTVALFRTAKHLTEGDKQQVLRFAEFLREAGRAPTPSPEPDGEPDA
jgi:transcriptional regulator with XRE-family HTH domain